MVHICPPEHTHGAKTTCYHGHGCRCEPCRQATARRYQERRTSKPKSSRTLAPCGTVAAARRHYRHGEPLDDACRTAELSYNRDRYRVAQIKEAADVAPAVTFDGVTVTITANLDDARAIAAAALDRALALDRTATTTAQASGQRRAADMLRAFHKTVATIARAAA